ncbi:hypothetical protein IGI49_000070 [Enterococcus sp. AZ071]|uniref:Uncharacterized protein n=1 Tax=Candidatus Enterococcus ferrettii TaxID=2815324 RepID=A0ABV0ERJ5_9ENTE
MFLFFFILFLLSFGGILYFNERNQKYHKISVVLAAISFIVSCALFPTDRLIEYMSTIDGPPTEEQHNISPFKISHGINKH